jgi:hypothetical protein
MTEIAMDIRPDKSVVVFWGPRRYVSDPGNDSPRRWFKQTSNGSPVSKSRRRRLERIYKYRDEYPEVRRFPRVKPDLKPGLPVYCARFGFGEIATIDGDDITVRFKDKNRLIEAKELVTRVEAEVDWHEYWLTGEKRRLREGKKLFIVKGLCRHGEWQVFLDRYEIPRSTADDLIRRYLDAILRSGETPHLHGYRANDVGDPARDRNNQTEDSDAAELAKLVEQEAEKRRGKTPTQNPEYWHVRIKLPPAIVTRCREHYKQPDAKEYWRRAAYMFIDEDPSSEE